MTTPAAARNSADQKLTSDELAQARALLEQTHNALIGATKGLSQTQWRFKPTQDRWSIAENLEHIVTVQERVLGPVLDQLPTAPPPPAGLDRHTVDSIVIHQFSARLDRFQAPEVVQPTHQIDPQELLNRYANNQGRLEERLESTPGLREHVMPAPPLRAISKGAYDVMDGYQWILAAAAHTERHVKQMLEVMADPAYPV